MLRKICMWCSAAVLLFVIVSSHASTCTPSFPLETGKALGWQGADAAYSVPLKDGRDIWIFSDTLYGPDRVVTGTAPRMTHNSIGVSRCDADGKWHLKYSVKRAPDGHAASFFSPKDSKTWYWAMASFEAKGDLWVSLLCIRPISKPDPGAMDFESCGADLARVRNVSKDPQHWKIDYFPLVKDGVKAYPAAAATIKDGFVYFFTMYESGARPEILTRVPLSGLDDPAAHLQFLANSGQWLQGLRPTDAKAIMQRGTTEMSVRYDPTLQKWFAILIDPAAFSDKVYLRTAPELTGPWTSGDVIYHIPELQHSYHHFDKDTFCYAAKEHPEFEHNSDLVFTYVCNTFSVPKLSTDLGIYFPKVVRMPMPALDR